MGKCHPLMFTENLMKLVKKGSDDLGLGCVNGIKTLAMVFIISGHAMAFIAGGPVQNPDFYAKVIQWNFWQIPQSLSSSLNYV